METGISFVWHRDAQGHMYNKWEDFWHWLGLEHLTCLRCSIFKRRWVFPCCCPLNVTQMCHQSVCLKLTKGSNKKPFCLVQYMTFACMDFPSSSDRFSDFCWLSLQQEDNSQTTGWRWVQPAQSSLLLPACLSFSPSGWLPTVCSGFLPLCPWQLSHAWALMWKEWGSL